MTPPRRVAILGGGMAGLTAAWQLSAPELRDRHEVTVYQRGFRLGGKGASSRGAHGRIEEHGLHVWLGYYDNAFRLMRDVYEELDRPRTDPDCPIATWRDAFRPAHVVGVGERLGEDWSHWVATFAANDATPGDAEPGAQLTMMALFERGMRLLADFSASLRPDRAPAPAVVLSASPEPPIAPSSTFADVAAFVRQTEIAVMVGAVESLRLLEAAVPRSAPRAEWALGRLERMRADLLEALDASEDSRRTWQLADLLLACMQGALRAGLVVPNPDFSRIDDLDFREWLAGSGAHRDTLESPLVRGLYDLVFAYEDGDTTRPRFSAGLGLFLATKLFFDYKGAIFWRLAAGMGDVVFAPLYQALRRRGVRFEFFHRVDALQLDEHRSRVGTIVLGRQARTRAGSDAYEPLVRVKGVPCFASNPLRAQLDGDVPADAESAWADRCGEERVTLRAGTDFDDVVLATSVGMVPLVCGEILEDSARWRAMVAAVATIPTQALQVWLTRDEAQLGWRHPGSTVSAYGKPFDTYASMTHTLAREDWPAGAPSAPRAIAYFCSVLADDEASDPIRAHGLVCANAREFLERRAGAFWPGAQTSDGRFRWELLAGDGLDAQYWRANVDPSDRYVQSLPGSGRARLRADASGYDNLFLAGDWIDCGLNAGCVEAAVLAGMQAANAVARRAPMDGVLGAWPGFVRAQAR